MALHPNLKIARVVNGDWTANVTKTVVLQTLATNDAKRGRGASNWGRYSNEDVDKALDAATMEFDAKRRETIYRHSVKLVTDDVGNIPLFHYQNIWAAKKGLKVVPILSDRTSAMQVTTVAK